MNIDVRIGLGQPLDLRGIFNVYRQTWLATYVNERAGITAADIQEHWVDQSSPANSFHWRRRLQTPTPGHTVLLAKDAGMQVIGICTAQINDDENEIPALYVVPEWQRRKVGTMLLGAMEPYLNQSQPTMLRVASYNEGAKHFYRTQGFTETGEWLADPRFVFKSGARIYAIVMRRPALRI